MSKKSKLTYIEKDVSDDEAFVFYVDKRCLSDEKYSKALDLQNLHWHDYFELEIILEGHGKHHFNDSVYDLHPGNAYIVTPIDFHSVAFAEKTDSNVVHIQFDSFTMRPEVTQLITSSEEPITAEFDEVELKYISILCDKLISEYENMRPDSQMLIKTILEQICILTVRKSKPISHTGNPNMRDETILQVVNYLNNNFRTKITMKQIAEKFSLNPNYLGEKFQKTLGVSFNSYVNDLRLTYALHLLKNSSLSINHISKEVGFSSVSYFIKLFSEKYGSSPQKMRKNK
ncbi:MAG: helix-turn-helix transcriptional regulator [Clostridia bacterium]|nr:helix-turn-helix transcriptional regulator [Clostridia bacterium]MBQ7014583.1 helix-turn-helix transcriptional regulator [Clostridia bacterium]